MKSQLNNALAFFQVVAIITNLSTFANAKIQNISHMEKNFVSLLLYSPLPGYSEYLHWNRRSYSSMSIGR